MGPIVTRADLFDRANWPEIGRRVRYSVKELAKQLGFSSRQLERFMQDHLGLTPKAWLDELQMQRIVELLNVPECSLKEVSYEAGFKRFERLCEKFKRRIGLSPGAWRARNGVV